MSESRLGSFLPGLSLLISFHLSCSLFLYRLFFPFHSVSLLFCHSSLCLFPLPFQTCSLLVHGSNRTMKFSSPIWGIDLEIHVVEVSIFHIISLKLQTAIHLKCFFRYRLSSLVSVNSARCSTSRNDFYRSITTLLWLEDVEFYFNKIWPVFTRCVQTIYISLVLYLTVWWHQLTWNSSTWFCVEDICVEEHLSLIEIWFNSHLTTGDPFSYC